MWIWNRLIDCWRMGVVDSVPISTPQARKLHSAINLHFEMENDILHSFKRSTSLQMLTNPYTELPQSFL